MLGLIACQRPRRRPRYRRCRPGLPSHLPISAPDDLMSAHGLPGAAEAAVQPRCRRRTGPPPGRRRYAPTAERGTSGSANAVRLSATATPARPPTLPAVTPWGLRRRT